MGVAEPGRRGPKPRYSADQVVEAAVAVADIEGLQAISVRRIAQELGVSPMSIYTYVPSKAELVGLMFDRVLGKTPTPRRRARAGARRSPTSRASGGD